MAHFPDQSVSEKLGSYSVIQGGMGIGVSGWKLARAVARAGQIGVVSGAALEAVFARRIQLGTDLDAIKRALGRFPFQDAARNVIDRITSRFNQTSVGRRFADQPMFTAKPSRELIEMSICASFVEVALAKENHTGLVGINLLEKIQLPHLYSLYGAMLAGVNLVIVGAGIPYQFPEAMAAFAVGEEASYKLNVTGARDAEIAAGFSPREFFGTVPELEKPLFLPIISSVVLGKMLARNAGVDGFIVEEKVAGGHNAPPRGKLTLDESGQPVYGPKDRIDYASIRDLGKPFYLGGSWSSPERRAEALALGANGVQVGSLFALSEESGFAPDIKQELRRMAFRGELKIFTDPTASPTGFPFKVAQVPGTLSDADIFARRERACDLGYLREAYLDGSGSVRFRCPAEPVERYLLKGGSLEESGPAKCLCNALLANVGLGQQRNGYPEPLLITLGDDLDFARRIMRDPDGSYTAAQAVKYLLG